MARCRCSEETCVCQLRGGPGVNVGGVGSATDPWVIGIAPAATGAVSVNDTPSVELDMVGQGTQPNPYVIVGHALLAPLLQFLDTPDVDFTITGTGIEGDPFIVSAELPLLNLTATGAAGDVMTLQADGTWQAGPAATVTPGVIRIGPGLLGDGSVTAPLRVDICTYDELKAACSP
jgi:hypothetical protein